MNYYLFAGACYYAAGGANDFIKSSEDLENLIENAKELLENKEPKGWYRYNWYHITDENMNIVAKSDDQAHC
jgi:hypothetical protein